MILGRALPTRNVVSVELFAKVFRACQKCGEPNPSLVTCIDCGTLNHSGEPCRNCFAPAQIALPWEDFCPRCGTPAVVEDQGVIAAWYANPFKQLRQWWKERRQRRSQ